MKSEWRQQNSSALQNFFQYSSWSVVWMIWILLIPSSPSYFYKLLRTVSNVPTTLGCTVTFMLHIVLSSLARFKYISVFSFLLISQWSPETVKSTRWQVLFFSSIDTRCRLLVGNPSLVCISKSQRILSVAFSGTYLGLCITVCQLGKNFSLLHNS